MHVSQVTTRKDLDQLEQKGLIKREHGYAAVSYTHLLGLSMVKWIVEAHGGEIHVESTLGQGTAFTFSFPCP